MSGDKLSHTLPIGYELNSRYHIESVLGEGGFGVTYKATRILSDNAQIDASSSYSASNNLSSIDTAHPTFVAIKEYYPSGIAARKMHGDNPYYVTHFDGKLSVSFKKGLERFRQEAYLLKEFYNLDSIVSVIDIFDANNTTYIVMEYIEGLTLKNLVGTDGAMPFTELLTLFRPLLSDLSTIHQRGLVHRDISPDNIIIGMDNRLHLIDFGSANHSNLNESKTYTVILKAGYAPPEQYSPNGKIGPWTDVYGISATIYYSLTGITPPDALLRMQENNPQEEIISNLNYVEGIMPYQIQSIIKALSLHVGERYPSISLFVGALTTTPQDDRITQIHINDTANDRHKPPAVNIKHANIKFKILSGSFIIIIPLIIIACIMKLRPGLITDTQSDYKRTTYDTIDHTEVYNFDSRTDNTNSDNNYKSDINSTNTPQSAEILTMVNMVGKNITVARYDLQSIDSDIEIEILREPNKEYERGVVIAQSIKPDTQFTKGNISSITLTVSLGDTEVSSDTNSPANATDNNFSSNTSNTTSNTGSSSHSSDKASDNNTNNYKVNGTKKDNGYTTIHIGD